MMSEIGGGGGDDWMSTYPIIDGVSVRLGRPELFFCAL